jgi:hypothetical protein
MIADFLGATDWDSPPPEMEIALSYSLLIDKIAEQVRDLAEPGREPVDWARRSSTAVSLYVLTPGIVNVMLNYKICVEHDLPLHPTVYYELKEARKYRIDHGLPAVDRANRLFRQSIALARSALRLDPDFSKLAGDFLELLPRELASFVYTGIRDNYTWRGSDPEILERLCATIRQSYAPDIIIAAAHGSIMPGLLLAEFLGLPLYFIRFSMFKRNDEEPIVTFSDEAWLYDFKDKKALLYDEDVAGGRTLTEFSRRVGPLFAECRTACSIRHAGASIKPDFCGKVWWD